MQNPYYQIGKRIRHYRKASGLTQSQLAEKSELSDNFIGLIERGEGKPTVQTINQIAKSLSVDLSDLFLDGSGNEKSTKQTIKEIERLLINRDPKDARLVLAVSKSIFERFPSKKRPAKP